MFWEDKTKCQIFFSVKLNSAEGAKIHLHSFWAIFALICHLCLFGGGGSLDLDESVQKIFLTVSCFQSAGRPRKDRHVEGLMCKQFAFTHKPVNILLRYSAFLNRLLLNFNSWFHLLINSKIHNLPFKQWHMISIRETSVIQNKKLLQNTASHSPSACTKTEHWHKVWAEISTVFYFFEFQGEHCCGDIRFLITWLNRLPY